MSRTTRIASGPSTMAATIGPPVMNALQVRIPRLLDVLGVVPPGQFRRDAHQFHGDDVEALVLQAGQYPAHQTPLDTIGLQQNERSLHRVSPMVVSGGLLSKTGRL